MKATDKNSSRKRRVKTSTKRMLTALAMFVVVGIGLAVHTGTGTPSAFGWDTISAICPLGALEAFLASKTAIPQGVVFLVLALVLILLLGRAFCGWLCPVPFLRRVFGGKKRSERDVSDSKESEGHHCAHCARHGCAARGQARESLKFKASAKDSRWGVLIAALASSAVFGFPVFCLVCPVGLSFATFIGLWRLFQFNETTLSLVIMPVILVLELFVLRKWCHRFCPLGALMSLVSKGNRTVRPKIDQDECLISHGKQCNICHGVCPENIDLHLVDGEVSRSECTKCGKCVDACPVAAISFKLHEGKLYEFPQMDLMAEDAPQTAPVREQADGNQARR